MRGMYFFRPYLITLSCLAIVHVYVTPEYDSRYSGLLFRNLIQVTIVGKPYELLYIPIMVT